MRRGIAISLTVEAEVMKRMDRLTTVDKRPSGPLDWPPAPPDGYRFYTPSPLPFSVRYLVAMWVPLSILAVLALTIVTHGLRLFGIALPQELAGFPLYVVSVLSLALLMLVVHELLHVLAAGLLGYEVSVEVGYETVLDWTFAVIPYGEFQSRTDTAVIALAPLLVVSPFGIAALVFVDGVVAAAGAFLLVLNSASAVGDVGSPVMVLFLPPGALLRHDREGREQYYVPEKAG